MQPPPAAANSTPPLPTAREGTVLTLRRQPQTKYQVLPTAAGFAGVSRCGGRADWSDCPGFLGTTGRACEDAAVRRWNGARPGSPSPELSPFRSAAQGRGRAPRTALPLRVRSSQSLGPLITSRSLTPAGPRVLSEVSCPRTHGLRQLFPASSLPAGLPLASPSRLPGFLDGRDPQAALGDYSQPGVCRDWAAADGR